MGFTVLMSLYDKESPDFLKESLDSLIRQTLVPDEIVIVEDGPVGKSLESVLQEFGRRYDALKIIRLPQNLGLGDALNEGLKHCSDDLVARMDTDDIAKPERFRKQVEFMESHPDIDVISAWIEEFEGNTGNVTSIRKLPETHEEILKFAKFRNPINHPVAMFRKSAVIKAGNYRKFLLFEDYYLWARMLMNGSKFHNIQESLLYFRSSPDMFGRRGGWKYARDEFKFQKELHKMGLISFPELIKNETTRFGVRIVPNFLRKFLYRKLMR